MEFASLRTCKLRAGRGQRSHLHAIVADPQRFIPVDWLKKDVLCISVDYDAAFEAPVMKDAALCLRRPPPVPLDPVAGVIFQKGYPQEADLYADMGDICAGTKPPCARPRARCSWHRQPRRDDRPYDLAQGHRGGKASSWSCSCTLDRANNIPGCPRSAGLRECFVLRFRFVLWCRTLHGERPFCPEKERCVPRNVAVATHAEAKNRCRRVTCRISPQSDFDGAAYGSGVI